MLLKIRRKPKEHVKLSNQFQYDYNVKGIICEISLLS